MNAKVVTVIGGGVTGVELAAEIAESYPCKVTLLLLFVLIRLSSGLALPIYILLMNINLYL